MLRPPAQYLPAPGYKSKIKTKGNILFVLANFY